MPIYEYRCKDCGFQNEYLQRMSDAPLTDCPECGKPSFSKMVSAAGFQLKGSGWYATDFKNAGAKPKTGTDKPADGGKKDATKTETSPSCGTGACPACS
jgi:putative FmdB family regulatory protein